MHEIYVGIDNGVTGSIGIIDLIKNETQFILTPVFAEQNYTKAKANISRIDTKKLTEILKPYIGMKVHVSLERPLVNPGRFKSTVSALRALEATLVVIEDLGFSRAYIDSKEWQKVLLPSGLKGSDDLKKASEDIGCRLFPQHADLIKKHKDADGMLIAEYSRKQNN
jgi:hypothetical protein